MNILKKDKKWVCFLIMVFLVAGFIPRSRGGDHSSGVYIGEVRDKDGDLQILMESKWISMHLMPSESMTIVRFVYRPTGNDILRDVQPKFIRGGGGLFQDNLWEQDWRFQELRSRFYDYKITDRGPEKAQIVFQTKTTGYVGYKNSGVISRLLSDIIIRRTVTLKADTPYIRVDVELINDDPKGYAKLPMYWLHHSAIMSTDLGDQVHRPSTRGVRTMGGRFPSDEHYIYDFTHGWSARMSEGVKEGLVYLMDYDYILHLYNCYTTTTEWMYDNVLILDDRPWKGTVYMIPVMGLKHVNYANPYFVAQVEANRNDDSVAIEYAVTSAYEKAHKVSFNTSLEYNHLRGEPKTVNLPTAEVEGVGLEPTEVRVPVQDPPPDPFVINTTAYVELPDGTLKKFSFQNFHVGEYGYGDNVRKDLKTPVCKLDRRAQKPYLPVPEADQKINRKTFKAFGVMGCNSRAYGVSGALEKAGVEQFDRGDCPGYTAPQNGLTDFPYDYDRLFDYQLVLYSNCDAQVLRRIGASILVEYVRRGGGLVFLGGDSAFTRGIKGNPFNDYLPFKPRRHSIEREMLQLNSPVRDHPVFDGVDLSKLPYCQYCHKLDLREGPDSEVLMKVGDHPFIVESEKDGTRVMSVLCTPFFDPDAMPDDKTHYLEWAEWEKLLANVFRYAKSEG
ncbi:MAG: hypothetical protein KGZ25_01235 [Planctomycetes bacterium]|nr:hypothetical protein [Planctomycetota bacterium]